MVISCELFKMCVVLDVWCSPWARGLTWWFINWKTSSVGDPLNDMIGLPAGDLIPSSILGTRVFLRRFIQCKDPQITFPTKSPWCYLKGLKTICDNIRGYPIIVMPSQCIYLYLLLPQSFVSSFVVIGEWLEEPHTPLGRKNREN